jgi:CRISPR-associated endonuclease/helicase Cas3
LRHAAHHGLERVIVVIPYTSIIDQTAKIYADILGEDAVLEHHSNLDPSKDTLENRHCVENWDSPIIVTTSVQFFETLHAARKRDLRKLHNVARSVVILDEVQTFPLTLIKPIKDALDRLTKHFKVTTVHCSATQPMLAQPDAREIVPDPSALFAITRKRVRVFWPERLEEPTEWAALAAQIRAHPARQVLTIVHSKRDAIDLAMAVGDDCIHLSTLMCPMHRREKLAEIGQRLSSGQSCIVVSTQLVEAGVDLDFPVVYRALAGVDSLAQAAGRCNREGRLAGTGEYHIFVAPSEPPIGTLRDGFKQVRSYLKRSSVDLFDAYLPKRYFGDLIDFKPNPSEIPTLEKSWDFPKVEELFKMIEDHDTPVVAPYGLGWLPAVQEAQLLRTNKAFRGLQRYTVSLPDRWLRALSASGVVMPLIPDSEESFYVLPGREDVYSRQFGFGRTAPGPTVLGVWAE